MESESDAGWGTLEKPESTRTFALGLAIFILACLPYLPALKGDFTWDDDGWVTGNAMVNAGLSGLRAIWMPFHQELHYYPVVFTLFWTEQKCFGLNPVAFHAVNIAIHGLAALMLWRLLRALNPSSQSTILESTAWLAALAWAVHPVQVETVTWVTEGKNTLSALFSFAAALAYLHSESIARSPESINVRDHAWRPKMYIMALALFILALLSKTVVCVFPVVIAVLLWWKEGRVRLEQVLRLIPLLIIGLTLGLLTTHREQDVVVAGYAAVPLHGYQRVAIACEDVLFYLRTLAIPYPLVSIYPRWIVDHLTMEAVLCVVVVAISTIGLWVLRKRIGRGAIAAWIVFLLILAPSLGFIDFYTMLYTFVADHYQYIGSAAMIVLVMASISRWGEYRQCFKTAIILESFLIFAFALCTFAYSRIYASNESMWAWNVAHNSEAWNAKHNLAIAYIERGKFDEAEALLHEAIAQYEPDDRLHRTLGEVLDHQGKPTDALREYERSLQLNPRLGVTYERMGAALEHLGRGNEAVNAFLKGIELSPEVPRLRFNAAQALQRSGRLAEARHEYEADLQLDPNDRDGWYNYGNLLLDLHEPSLAVKAYEHLVSQWPDFIDGWFNLASAYHEAGDNSKAETSLQHAKQLEAASRSSNSSIKLRSD